MAKNKTAYFCQSCGASSPKWLGKCPSCGEWNTYVEELIVQSPKEAVWKGTSKNLPVLIQEVKNEKTEREPSGDAELDRVLGGGIVAGSLILIGGEPGIGKSTLMLQVAVRSIGKVLYVSGEESLQQIRMRAERIGIRTSTCYLLSETSLTEIFMQIAGLSPDLVIIDSIQTLSDPEMDAAPGSVSQVRECTGQLMRFAKNSQIPVFLVGHINKEGNIAGPKVMEHMVDTVLQFEGDRHHLYRILRTTKNRFGSTAELGIYQMGESGLREVSNPSEILLSGHAGQQPGVAIAATVEGNRPLLIEVQALVSPANYGTAQRASTGYDVKRLHMLVAVLEKRLGLRLGNQDIYLNITGGIRIDDPAVDLAVCAAVFSSYHEMIIPHNHCFTGEVGLGGEIRLVNRLEQRLKEAEKLGFTKATHAPTKEKITPIRLERQLVSDLKQLFEKMIQSK